MTTYGNGDRGNVGSLASERWIPSRNIAGYVAELLVEVYALLSADGKLTSWRPNIDIDHKDIVFDELGSRLLSAYVQVKCATRLSKGFQINCLVKYPDGKPITNDRFVYVFAFLNVKSMTLEKIWLVPCKDFNRLALRPRMKGPGVVLAFDGHARKRRRNVGPGRWDRFVVTPEDLGPRFLKLIKRARAGAPLRAPGVLQMMARP